MKKVFNKYLMDKAIETIYNSTGFRFSHQDIVDKSIFKKIKYNLEDISNAKVLQAFLSEEDLNEMIERFFPCKMEEIKNSGLPFKTIKFYFDSRIEKIIWIVNHNDNERIMKLRTNNYLERTVDERKKVFFSLKKILDPLYGLWLEGDEENWYVTDLNIVQEKYRKLYGVDKQHHTFYNTMHYGYECGKYEYLITVD